MYARRVGGRTLTFGVSGKLWHDALVMYDRETRSLWSHVTGVAIAGPLAGKRLEAIPAVQTTWSRWAAAHPATLALAKDPGVDRSAYEAYYRSARLGVLGRGNPDPTLPGKERVFGLALGGEAVAYPLARLAVRRLVNDLVGGQLIVVSFAGHAAVAFLRRVGKRQLTFRPAAVPGRLTDDQTHTEWDALTGKALAGPLRGQRLRPVPGTLAFWFAWRQFYPRARPRHAAVGQGPGVVTAPSARWPGRR